MPTVPTRPNLLLITSDQQHHLALGSVSPQIRTPHLDRLAARGVRFDRAYCPNPTCTPTRASLLTGMYPSAHGAYTLGTKLDERVPRVIDLLRDQGYRTGLVGKAHFQPLRSTPDCPSVEAYPTLRDLDFWRTFNDTHTPWYGFDHCELARNHTDEGHVGQHYAIWMEQQGLADWRDYFQARNDGVKDTRTDASQAPPTGNARYGMRGDTHWKLPAELHYTTWTAERTNAFIAAQTGPWFCWSSYHDPHPPYAVPEPWASMYDPAEMDWLLGDFAEGEFDDMPPPHAMTREPNPDFKPFNKDGKGNHGYHSHAKMSRDDLRVAAACYAGMVSFMDDRIGTTLDLLDERGLTDDTLVVFTSDHGHFLGQHGLLAKGPFHYEDVIRVPMIAAGPGLGAGRVNAEPQTLVDLPAVFAGRATGEVPLWMQGRDVYERWQADGGRAAVIVENHHNRHAVHLRTLVTKTHKLTVYRDRPDWGELFDLENDPHERTNLYHDDPALRGELMRQLVLADLEREPAPQPRVYGA
jgi:arylsulfatase A-like enzyme